MIALKVKEGPGLTLFVFRHLVVGKTPVERGIFTCVRDWGRYQTVQQWIISGPLQIDITKEPLVDNGNDH